MTHPKKIWHRGDDGVWLVQTMEAIDARHACEVDPENWSMTDPGDVEGLVGPGDEPLGGAA